MTDVTFIVPATPHHETLLERALASITQQTVPVETLVIRDPDLRGAGWARNQGIQQVKTRFLVFLDADDEVLPAFTERTLSAYKKRRFVYTDWYDENIVTKASECPWTANTRNVITCLLTTEDARSVGGFDETLEGMEDTQMFLKLLSSGICGLHVHEPLFRYRPNGARSKAFYNTPAYHYAIQRFNAEFGSKPMAECGSCGGSPYAMPDVELLPIGEQQPGDVLAQALWSGNRQERGRVTGRLYPRTSVNGSRVWVAPRDIDGAPDKWTRIIDLPKSPATTSHNADFQTFAQTVMQSMLGAPVQKPEPVYSVHGVQGEVKPNVGKLLGLYQQAN